ncbi:hypothetical protein ANCCEY_02144 [Ancylostoma ceylanicum]|uniref:Protection of telomeres protein 1 ssDNA-binding domain-containing protein n=1 Tax=Ancylostoma ceylanicum TaxID=53326 RepID=A0A0D6M3N7_9BILA|nr:hypothetical protein ANCCEY_02144 [Ancylostoma ceylanicum]
MAQNEALKACIFNSSCLEQFYLKRAHQVCTIINSLEEEFIVPPADEYCDIPGSYFYDVLLFGEWIHQAASLKSGAVVVLRNLHIFVARGYKVPLLVMHEGTAYGRGIIEIQDKLLSQHHRCIKLENDIRIASEENRKEFSEPEGQPKEDEEVSVLAEKSECPMEEPASASILSPEDPSSKCSTPLAWEGDAVAESTVQPNSSQALSLDDEDISEERLGYQLKVKKEHRVQRLVGCLMVV